MKKFITALTLTALTASSFAATSGTLLLKGTIAPLLSIAVTPEAIASTLDLTASPSNLKVATVQEKSNSNTGYKVTIASQNLGQLKNGSVDSVTYSLSYNGSSVNLAAPVTQTNSAAAAVTVNKDVNISYTGRTQDLLVAGDYTDTITFTIAAN